MSTQTTATVIAVQILAAILCDVDVVVIVPIITVNLQKEVDQPE